MPFFYYCRHPLSDTWSARVASEWPPIGGEENVILFKKAISVEESKLTLQELKDIYPLDTDTFNG